jgi:hypothetical protein
MLLGTIKNTVKTTIDLQTFVILVVYKLATVWSIINFLGQEFSQ